MQGNRGSVFGNIFFNPLVWVGCLLTALTLNYEKDVFQIFFSPKTYELLAIGASVYVALFGIHYTEKMEHIDWAETLMEVIVTIGIILTSWIVSLSLIIGYQMNGENMKSRIEKQLAERAALRNEMKTEEAAKTKAIEKVIQNMGLNSGKSYVVTPDGNGGYAVEVIGE